MGIQMPHWEGALLRGHVLAHCNIPTHECISQCLPAAAAGEFSCPVHAADKFICHHEGCQDSDAAF